MSKAVIYFILKTSSLTGGVQYSITDSKKIAVADPSKLKKKDEVWYCFENIMYNGIVEEVYKKESTAISRFDNYYSKLNAPPTESDPSIPLESLTPLASGSNTNVRKSKSDAYTKIKDIRHGDKSIYVDPLDFSESGDSSNYEPDEEFEENINRARKTIKKSARKRKRQMSRHECESMFKCLDFQFENNFYKMICSEKYDYQLHGNCEGSVELGNSKIYCKEENLYYALGSSSARRVAARLIPGVFKPEAIKNSTRTGQPPRISKIVSHEATTPLHRLALQVIIEFAKFVEEKMEWEHLPDDKITRAITIKVNKLKNIIINAEKRKCDYIYK